MEELKMDFAGMITPAWRIQKTGMRDSMQYPFIFEEVRKCA